jgi:Chalcone isomerase-like
LHLGRCFSGRRAGTNACRMSVGLSLPRLGEGYVRAYRGPLLTRREREVCVMVYGSNGVHQETRATSRSRIRTPGYARGLRSAGKAKRGRWGTLSLAVVVTILLCPYFAHAAEMAGVFMPAVQSMDSRRLVLNGIGLRTYSVFSVRIYVTALYVEHVSHDAEALLNTPGIKLLQIHFVHDVGVIDARRAWRTGLMQNCSSPCVLSSENLSRFLAALRPIHAGENVSLLFGPEGLSAFEEGRMIGQVMDLQFSKAMLASFIGLHPATESLRRELLGLQ